MSEMINDGYAASREVAYNVQGRAVGYKRSPKEWAVLGTLRAHQYDTRNRGSKPDDPGWHVCSCGWEGYWSDFHPHLAERIVEVVDD